MSEIPAIVDDGRDDARLRSGAIALIVLQPTSLCNLNCRYCYVPNRRNAAVMEDRILEAAIVKALSSELVQNQIEFLFHAGEPLMTGIQFYRRVVDLIQQNNPRGIAVTKAIQTNATLITDEWCDLFAQHEFHLGVSIDGPQFLHDHQRVNWAGKGSHEVVMRGVRKLNERQIPFGAICVLTRETLAYPDELFTFFVENGFSSVGFNVEEIENVNTTSTLISRSAEETRKIEGEFRAFLARVVELWEKHDCAIKIREFYDTALFMQRKQRNPDVRRIPDETADMGIITIQRNGDMAPYSPEFGGSRSVEYQNFVVGNILTSTYEDILSNAIYRKIRNDVHRSITLCANSCQYFDLCGGAFLSNKYWQNGTLLSTETMTCRLTRQTVVDLLLRHWTSRSRSQSLPASQRIHARLEVTLSEQ